MKCSTKAQEEETKRKAKAQEEEMKRKVQEEEMKRSGEETKCQAIDSLKAVSITTKCGYCNTSIFSLYSHSNVFFSLSDPQHLASQLLSPRPKVALL